MDLPKRKQNRLGCYDYRNPGYYFITICTKDKEKLFWLSDESDQVKLSDMGMIVEQCIRKIPEVYPMVRLDKYVVMPNHIHLILCLEGHEEHPNGPSISVMIGQMKSAASKKAKKKLWQETFHDHIIRNEKDYQMIWQYIEDNPRKWNEDGYYLE